MLYTIRPKRDLGLEETHFIPSLPIQMKPNHKPIVATLKPYPLIGFRILFTYYTITHILVKHKSKKIFSPHPSSFGHRRDFFFMSTHLHFMHKNTSYGHHLISKHFSSLISTNLRATPSLKQEPYSAKARIKVKFTKLNVLNPKHVT